MTTTLKIHPFSMPLTELSAVIHFLTGVRDERMGPAGIAPSELLTPEEKAALLTPPADECGQPAQFEEPLDIKKAEEAGYAQGKSGGKDNNPFDGTVHPKQWDAFEDGFEMGKADALDAKIQEADRSNRASADGDQQPYAVNAGGSDDFAEEAFAPKPPALPVAPAAPGTTAPTSSPAGSVTVDKDGLPWDERIHSGSKATNADGTWRKKRGVDNKLVAEVEEQLGKLMAPEVPAAPKPPVPPVPGLASTAAPAPAAPPAPPPPAPVVTAPAGPSSPAPAASTAEPQGAQAVTFASLFKRVTELKKANDGKTFPGEDDILAALGQPTWLAIASAKDQALIEAAWGLLP